MATNSLKHFIVNIFSVLPPVSALLHRLFNTFSKRYCILRCTVFWAYEMSFLASAFIITLISSVVAAELTAVVNTTNGPVQGEIKTTVMKSIRYSSFRGIRYGEPPIGWQRFKPPIPAAPWVKVFNATADPPDCFQTGSANDIVNGTEDCLFLNVFTPVTNLPNPPTNLKSVMIYLVGGAWRRGTSAIWMFGPDFLIEKDIILVTFNFRLGVLGFLNMNHPNATGNASLKDQRLVFQWVQKNIEKFGGNPNNVTLLGGSSGGMSTFYHAMSEASAGLFQGIIAMSGTPLVPWGFHDAATAQRRTETLTQLLGINSTDQETLLKAFYSASAEDLTAATYHIPEIIAFNPTIENATIATDPVLTECFIKKWFTGNFTKVPLLMGFMDQETVCFACPGVEAYMLTIKSYVETAESIGFKVPDSIEKFEEIYATGARNWSSFNYTAIQDTLNATADLIFIAMIDMTQQILATHYDDKPIYYYHVSFDYPKSLHKIRWNCLFDGPTHGDDVAYIFHIPIANFSLDLNDPLALMRERVTTMLSNFAKYGNPTPNWVTEYSLDITWPDSKMTGACLDFGNELSIVPRPTNDDVRLIQSYTWQVLPTIADCRRESVDCPMFNSNSDNLKYNVIIVSVLLCSILFNAQSYE